MRLVGLGSKNAWRCLGSSKLVPYACLSWELLNLDLRGLVGDYFRDTFVIAYLARHADVPVSVVLLRIAKPRTITFPNQQGSTR